MQIPVWGDLDAGGTSRFLQTPPLVRSADKALRAFPEGARFAAAALCVQLMPLGAPGVILAPVRADGSPSGLREGLAAGGRELALYVAAGAAYVAIGVTFPEFLFTWAVAAGYLVLCVVLVPALVHLLQR